MTRLLVTGSGGVIGQALLPLLKGYEVYAVTRGSARLPPDVTPVKTDLLNHNERRALIAELKPELCIHLAWDQQGADFRESLANSVWLFASFDLLDCFWQNGGRRFLFAGSSSEYDMHSGGFKEDGAVGEGSLYGQCKRLFTQVAGMYNKATTMEVAVARYFTVYGEHDRHEFGAIPSAIDSFARGLPVLCKSPFSIRDYISADDAAAATAALLDSGITGAVNIASGEPRAMREVFSLIAEIMGCPELLSFGDVPGTALTADVSRMHGELGYRCVVDFREGIARTVKWRLKNLRLP